MRRKPLFPPPHHPTTGKRLADKGRQSRTVVTVNGKIETYRRWWYGVQIGSVAAADAILDPSGATITPGVLELACRVNLSATSFRKAADVLNRTAQVKLSGERLRQEVEAVGRRVLKSQQDNAVALTWHAKDLHSHSRLVGQGISPQRISFAGVWRAYRRSMREYRSAPDAGERLRQLIDRALIDPYKRRNKTSRDFPLKKQEQSAGSPILRKANRAQVQLAMQVKRAQTKKG